MYEEKRAYRARLVTVCRTLCHGNFVPMTCDYGAYRSTAGNQTMLWSIYHMAAKSTSVWSLPRRGARKQILSGLETSRELIE